MENSFGPNFLIVGLEKSGTHWVAALLNAHPEIACFPALAFLKESGEFRNIGEIHLFNTLASLEPNTENKFTRPISTYSKTHIKFFADLVPFQSKVSKEELYKMFIKRYNELCNLQRQGKRLVGESSPAYVFHMDFIDSFYSNIKKLCIIRNPKDKVVSWHFNQVRKGRKLETEPITDDFIIDYCKKRIINEYDCLKKYSGNIHCFTYEELSQNAKKVICDILDYLGVEKTDNIINSMIKQGSFKNLTTIDNGVKGRERGEESIMSHYRKGIVGDWKNYLSSEQVKLIDKIVLDLRKEVLTKYNLIIDN